MVIIYASAKSSSFLSGWWQTWRTVTKKKDVFLFLLLLSDVNGWFFHFRPPGGSTDLIAPKDSSQAGSLSRWATLLPLNARSVRPSVHAKRFSQPAHTTAGSQFSVSEHLLKTQPALKLVHRPHSFNHPCFFLKMGIKKRLKPIETQKRKKKKANEALIERCF